MIKQLVEATEDGFSCSVQEAITLFMYKERRKKKPFPWKVALEIGPDIRIQTVGYIQVQ